MAATLAAIAVGAVLGAWARYGLALAMNGRSWLPWGTFVANAIGGFLIGLALAHLAAKPELSPLWRVFFVTGFLGALTTFSSFSAEVIVLVQEGAVARAMALAAMHLLASLVLTALGFLAYRQLA
ncbi:MAG: fluoride efflux transporter CrcB [Burkholderiales bacterium]|nr:fluoride efflux transporter CrcB [Burkholderiales bacterium]